MEQLGPSFQSLDQPDHPHLSYGFRNEAVATMLPNERASKRRGRPSYVLGAAGLAA